MCDQINPALRKRMIREMADEIRRWFREWRRRNTVTGDQALQDYKDKGQTIRRNEQANNNPSTVLYQSVFDRVPMTRTGHLRSFPYRRRTAASY